MGQDAAMCADTNNFQARHGSLGWRHMPATGAPVPVAQQCQGQAAPRLAAGACMAQDT